MIEHDGNDLATQRATFYTEPEGSHPARHYQGHNFTTVCKVVECNSYEQVKSNGAVAPEGAATKSDGAQCVPNPEQLETWARAEEYAYNFFYTFLGLFSTVYWAFGARVMKRGDAGMNWVQHAVKFSLLLR